MNDPVADLRIELRPRGRLLEIAYDRDGISRVLIDLAVPDNPGPGLAYWLLVHSETDAPRFVLIPQRDVGTIPAGRKVVGVVSVSPGGRVYRAARITAGNLVPARPSIEAEPATADELELVAAVADRFEDGTTLLGDLAEADLVVEVRVSRLTVPLGTLRLAGGRFRWTDPDEAPA